MKLSLKLKLTISVVSAIIVFGLIAVGSVFLYSKNIIFELQKENLRKIGTEHSHEARQIFDNIMQMSATLGRQEDIKEYLSSDEVILQEPHILQHLNIFNIEELFSAIYVMDKDGHTLVSTNLSFVDKNYSFRDYFKEAIKGQQSASVSRGVTSGKLGYYFSSPVLSNDGNILGVVVIKARPEKINETLDVSSYSDESHIMLTDEFGVVIYADKSDRLYKSLGTLSELEKNIIKEKRKYDGINIESIQYSEVKDQLSILKTVKILNIYDQEDGESEIISVGKIQNYPFYLVVEEEEDIYLQPAIKIAYILSLIIFVAALLSVIFILILISNFTKPISELKRVAKEISKGNLSARANIKTGDEIEAMAEAFNNMAFKMEKNIKNVESEVKRRTQRLEKLNAHMIGREMKMVELKKKDNRNNK